MLKECLGQEIKTIDDVVESYKYVVEDVYYKKFKNIFLEEKDDLLQEGMIAIFRYGRKYFEVGEEDFKRYIYATVELEMKKYLRKDAPCKQENFHKKNKVEKLVAEGWVLEDALIENDLDYNTFLNLKNFTDDYISINDDDFKQDYNYFLGEEDFGIDNIDMEILLEKIAEYMEDENKLKSWTKEDLIKFVKLKMAGYTGQEIADSIGCVRRTVTQRTKDLRDFVAENFELLGFTQTEYIENYI